VSRARPRSHPKVVASVQAALDELNTPDCYFATCVDQVGLAHAKRHLKQILEKDKEIEDESRRLQTRD
jgi:hypothetical protein